MDEEELLAQQLEAGFVEEPLPPMPPVEDDFFNVDSITGNVGIGTSIPINTRFHIISRDPYPAVRILQKGTGDVLLIDNKDIADQNDPPLTPYLNIKNDGRIGVGTTVPLAEFHLVTEKEGDILIGGVIGTGPLVSATDSGVFFSGLGNTVSSGLFTEVDGLLVDLAANVQQVGVVDTSRVGGIIRLDTRKEGEYSTDLGDYNSFTLKGYPIGLGTTGEYNVLTANLDTSDIHIAPVKGEVYVGAYSSTTSVGIGTTAIDEQYRLYVNGNTGIAGTLSLPDYSKITLGISSRLELYHDPVSGNSYLIESNLVGNLVIAGDDIEFKNAGLAETYAYFRTNGAVELYYDNEKKFETNLDGILVGTLGISTVGIISGPAEIVLDPASVGDDTGIVRIKGDLFVEGGTTQIYSTVVTIADIRVGIASTVFDDNRLLQDAGIEIGIGTVQKRLTYNFLSDALKSSENFDLAAGKVYKIQGNEVLSLTTVGASVTTSYLQKVGTLIDLTVAGLTSTQDLYVSGFATVNQLSATQFTADSANLGIASIGFATITSEYVGFATISQSRLGISTISYANITNANIGFTTIREENVEFSFVGYSSVGYSTITSANIGIATVGYATITSADIGISTVGYSFISEARIGIVTVGFASITGATIGVATVTSLTTGSLTGTGGGGISANLGVTTISYADIKAADIGIATISYSDIFYLNQVAIATVGFASISRSIIGIATIGYSTITSLDVGIATIGFANISNGNIGIITVGYSTITSLDVGIATIANLNVLGISTFKSNVIFDSTGSIQIPAGTTEQRIGAGVTGEIRFNTSIQSFEGYGPNGNWRSLSGVRDIDGNTYIIPEISPGADDNTLYFYTNGVGVATLSETNFDLKVPLTVGYSTITSLDVGIATVGYSTITSLDVGIATVGYSTITSLDVGIATVGYSTITSLDVGIVTIGTANLSNLNLNNLGLGSTDGTPYGQVGILTVGAISIFNPSGQSDFGDATYILSSKGQSTFDSTGIGLSWTALNLDTLISIGGTTGLVVAFEDNTENNYAFNLYPVPNGVNLGIATVLYVSRDQLRWNSVDNILTVENINLNSNSYFTGISTFQSGLRSSNVQIGVNGIGQVDTFGATNLVLASGSGTILVNDNLTISDGNTFTANGNIVLGNANTDTITATARFISDLLPNTTAASRNIGLTGTRWSSIWSDAVTVDNIQLGVTNANTIDTSGAANTLTLASGSGTVSVSGNLSVTGNTTLGDGTGTDTTTVNSQLNVTGNVSVTGNSTLGDGTGTDTTTVNGLLSVTGNSTLGNGLGDTTTVNSQLNVTGNVSITGITTLGDGTGTDTTTVNGPLNVTGTATLAGTTVSSLASSGQIYTETNLNVRAIPPSSGGFPSATETSTITSADVGKCKIVTSASVSTVTIQNGQFSIGDAITIVNRKTSSITITISTTGGLSAGQLITAGATTVGNKTLIQNGVATILCVAGSSGVNNTFLISGTGI